MPREDKTPSKKGDVPGREVQHNFPEEFFLRMSAAFPAGRHDIGVVARSMNPTAQPAEEEGPLIRAAQRRDPAAFAALVRRHQLRIRGFLAVRLRHHHDVEDLAQEVFITAFRKIDQCHPDGPMEPWLRRIAINLVANHRRKFRATPIGLMEEFLGALDRRTEEYCDGDREIAALEALEQCLQGVEAGSRELLTARYGNGEPMEDLAHRLGRKPSAVSMQLHRLRVLLGNCIDGKINRERNPQ